MKQVWMVFIVLLFAACHHHDHLEPEPTPQPEPKNRVVIVYIAAENSLSSPYATSDLEEMRQAIRDIPDSCQLVVYFDNSDSSQKPKILSFNAHEGEKVIYQFSEDPISTDSTTMQQVLNTIIARYPADNYGLVMWSHASGWIPSKKSVRKTFGIDNGQNLNSNVGMEMEISTLVNVLKNTGVLWDYIFFDACFMQCVEVAYDLRHVTRWCIGSPAEIPGNGAPYDHIMADLFRPSEEAWQIARDYYEYYQWGGGVVLSAIRTSELERLAAATAPYIASLDAYPATKSIDKYLVAGESSKPEYFDMSSAMYNWLSAEEYAAWREVLEQAVPYRYATESWTSQWGAFYRLYLYDIEHVSCMSMYIPVEGSWMNAYFSQCSWYQASGWSR